MGIVHALCCFLSDQYLERRPPLAGSLLPWLWGDPPPVFCSSVRVPSGSRTQAFLCVEVWVPPLLPSAHFVGAPGHPPFSPARCGPSMALWSPSFSSELQIDETHPAHQSHSPRPCLTQICAFPHPSLPPRLVPPGLLLTVAAWRVLDLPRHLQLHEATRFVHSDLLALFESVSSVCPFLPLL